MAAKQLNIKNRTSYFYNDLINALNFQPNNLKLDKKTWKDIDIIILVMSIKINQKIGV